MPHNPHLPRFVYRVKYDSGRVGADLYLETSNMHEAAQVARQLTCAGKDNVRIEVDLAGLKKK